jgi:hypothetical protein
MDQTPSWVEDEDFPPLSPRAAVRSARDGLSALVTDPENWTMNGIQLQPGGSKDKWVYVVSFWGPMSSPYGGLVPEFRMIVLLDGTAVKPEISTASTNP